MESGLNLKGTFPMRVSIDQQKTDPEEFILQGPSLIIILHQIGKEECLNSVLRY